MAPRDEAAPRAADEASTAAPRGRRSAFDAEAVARVAVALFDERGYDAVSMTDIAEAAGLSRRSLFRYFPGKADLIWDGFAEVQEAQQRHRAEAPADADPVATLIASVLAGVSALPELRVTRTRLRIIGSHPELIAFGSGRMHRGSLETTQYLIDHGVEELRARVAADAIVTASFNGYLWWATRSDDATPEATVRRALEALAGIA